MESGSAGFKWGDLVAVTMIRELANRRVSWCTKTVSALPDTQASSESWPQIRKALWGAVKLQVYKRSAKVAPSFGIVESGSDFNWL